MLTFHSDLLEVKMNFIEDENCLFLILGGKKIEEEKEGSVSKSRSF